MTPKKNKYQSHNNMAVMALGGSIGLPLGILDIHNAGIHNDTALGTTQLHHQANSLIK